MKKARFLALAMGCAMAFSGGAGAAQAAGKEFETAADAVKRMGVGWNLGNTLDSTGDYLKGASPKTVETAWGNPLTQKPLMEAVKAAGFGAVRIPVTWKTFMNADHTIDEAWLKRVEEIVKMALDSGLYCVINVHHDTGGDTKTWLQADKARYGDISKRYARLWRQVAERFNSYGERLLFESFNELLDEKASWNEPKKAEAFDVINDLNQLFVDTVRATGGNNAQRNLICTTYGGSPSDAAVGAFTPPTDTAKGRVIAQVHMYRPDRFTGTADWITRPTAVFDAECEKELDALFALFKTRFTDKGLPLVIGEFGAQDKNGNTRERARYAAYVAQKASEQDIACFWWDDGGKAMRLFDRSAYTPLYPAITDAMLKKGK